MSKPTIEQRILAARPSRSAQNVTFTDAVMQKLQNREIISSQFRRTNVKQKETFIMKLRNLHKPAVIALALVITLATAGTAYAVYQLWSKPEIHVSPSTTSSTGRDQVSIASAQCGDASKAAGYELKKNATITPDQIAKVVQARCELDTIGTWANKTYGNNDKEAGALTGKPYDRPQVDVSMATHITEAKSASITFKGLTKYEQRDETFDISASTKYIADGKEVSASIITPDDSVVYVVKRIIAMTPSSDCDDKHCSYKGEPKSQTLLAVVKLSLPFEYYDQLAWQSLSERMSCEGNPEDNCLKGYVGSIDIHTGSYVPPAGTKGKEIQGTVTAINGKTFTLKSSTGTLFTFTAPSDIIAAYNTNRAPQYYNNQIVKIGSQLIVRYNEPADKHSKTQAADALVAVQLQTESVRKTDPVQAY
ncbi:hypothetical protein EON76_04540 [bacterium]|nr:MAG: hypothetical protein EON76_04540 [bacterium]